MRNWSLPNSLVENQQSQIQTNFINTDKHKGGSSFIVKSKKSRIIFLNSTTFSTVGEVLLGS
jgi:hypothetical protein